MSGYLATLVMLPTLEELLEDLVLADSDSNSSAVAKSTRRTCGGMTLPCAIPSAGWMDAEVVTVTGASIGVSLGISLWTD